MKTATENDVRIGLQKILDGLAPSHFGCRERKTSGQSVIDKPVDLEIYFFRERTFFRALLEDVGSRYAVFAKVRLGDIIWLANEPENRKYHNNQLQCKHFDFLLCEKGTYKPLLVIELDDSSHDKYEHRERDEFKDKVCADIGLQLWRPRVQQTYAKGFIAEQVRSRIQVTAAKQSA